MCAWTPDRCSFVLMELHVKSTNVRLRCHNTSVSENMGENIAQMSENIAQTISSLLGQCKVHVESQCLMLVCTHASMRYQEETQGMSSAWVVRGASDFRAK